MILAIDFGGTRTRAGWFDAALELRGRTDTLSRVDEPVAAVIARLVDTARQVIPAGEMPAAVGVSAPGPLDAAQGVIHHARTLPGWESVALGEQIRAAFPGVPVFMNNDANLAAVAEFRSGAGQGCNPMVYLTISTGIGGGMIVDGRLFTGWRQLAIEPGHMRFPMEDGSVKALEELASGTALGTLARERLQRDEQPSTLRDVATVDGHAVGLAAHAGDALALDVVRDAGRWLGLGLVNMMHLFNPQAIVLGGSVAVGLGDLLLRPAKETIRAHVMDPAFYDESMIRLAALGDDVCLYGAAYYSADMLGAQSSS